MEFIHKKEVLFETKEVTYGKIYYHMHQHKEETHHTTVIVGGKILTYDGTHTILTATVKMVKL